MTTVFIAGSMNIKQLDPEVKKRIDNIVASKFNVVVGDAEGVDTSIQSYLVERGVGNAVVYCSGTRPRNNVGHWPVHSVATKFAAGSRAFFTAKDLEMAEAADYGLMIWDAKSTGTLSNVIELLSRNKKTVVFVNQEFKTIGTVADLELLAMSMSDHARRKADEKIRLNEKIEALKHEQSPLFA